MLGAPKKKKEHFFILPNLLKNTGRIAKRNSYIYRRENDSDGKDEFSKSKNDYWISTHMENPDSLSE